VGSDTYLAALYGMVPTANYVAFNSALDLLGISRQTANFLWAALANLTVGNDYNSASFELPALVPPEWFKSQSALVIDDKKSRSTVILRGSRGLQPANLSAVLRAGGHEIPAEAITALANGRDLKFVFPSLTDLKIAPRNVAIEVEYDNHAASCPQLEMCSPVWVSSAGLHVPKDPQPSPEDPRFTLRAGASVIRATKDGVGKLDLTVGVQPEGASRATRLTVSGATVEQVSQAGQAPSSHPGVEFPVQVGAVLLTLRNLSPGHDVIVEAKKQTGKALTLKVVAETGK
jgi:hypothetical protein